MSPNSSTAKAIALRELDTFAAPWLRRSRATLQLGAMVEVPSLLWELDLIAERADFLSVGSNDLVQYHVCRRSRQHAGVQTLRHSLAACAARARSASPTRAAAPATPVTLCGEMGGRPLEALALLAHRLSLAVHVAVVDRTREVHDPRPRSRRGAGLCRDASRGEDGAPSCARSCATYAMHARRAACSDACIKPSLSSNHENHDVRRR